MWNLELDKRIPVDEVRFYALSAIVGIVFFKANPPKVFCQNNFNLSDITHIKCHPTNANLVKHIMLSALL